MTTSNSEGKPLKDQLPVIEKIVSKTLDLIGLKDYSIKTSLDKDKWIHVDINYPDQGLLIGHRGETLKAMQLIFRLIAYRQLEQWMPIVVNVGDYLEKRKESLERLAQNVSQKAKFSQKFQELNNLGPAERRIIHLYFKDSPDVITESVDTDFGRTLIIKPKG